MAYIRKLQKKKGIVFKAEVWQREGGRVCRSFRTKAEALQWSRSQEDIERTKRVGGFHTVRIVFDDYFEHFMENYAKHHHSPGWQYTDRQMYKNHIKPILGPLKLNDIHPVDIQRVLRRMHDAGQAPSSINRVRQALSKMFNEAVLTDRFLSFNPVSAVKKYKEIQKPTAVLNMDEAQRLLNWADSKVGGIGIHLGLQLGLRQGEIVGLKWDAVDLSQRNLEVRRKWEKKTKTLEEFTKGKTIRVLGIYPDALLQKLLSVRNSSPTSEYVVCNEAGEFFGPDQLIKLLRCGIKDTGIKKITVHGLRHSFASLYRQSGGDLYDLQKIMGHQSVSTTERYRHTDPEYLRQKCNVLDIYSHSAQTPPTDGFRDFKVVEGTS